MSKHIFITGGAGFIGSHTAQALLDRGDRVTVLDAFDFGYDPSIKENNARMLMEHPNCKIHRGDIRDAELLHQLFSFDPPDAVIHLAARAGVRPSLEDPTSYSDINITGTIRILEAMRDQTLRIWYLPPSSIYGARKVPSAKGQCRCRPVPTLQPRRPENFRQFSRAEGSRQHACDSSRYTALDNARDSHPSVHRSYRKGNHYHV